MPAHPPVRIAFDTETWLIQDGLLAPPMVCGSFMSRGPDAEFPDEPLLHLRDDALDAIESVLTMTDWHIVGKNIAYDFGVICHERPRLLLPVFRAYRDGRIREVEVRDKLIAIARGDMKDEESGKKMEFSMEAIMLRRFGIDLSFDKKDPNSWRLRYRELDGVPLEQWPEGAVSYPKRDARYTMDMFEDQARECELADVLDYLPNEREQTRRAWCLHLKGMWGVRTEAEAVRVLHERIKAIEEDAHAVLKMPAAEAYRVLQAPPTERFKKLVDHAFDGHTPNWQVPDGEASKPVIKSKQVKRKATGLIEVEESRDSAVVKALVERDFTLRKMPVPMTAPSAKFPQGQVSTAGEVFEATSDPRLLLLAAIGNDEKIGSVWLTHLLAGIGQPICPKWNNPVATGRTSCFRPPMQQPMRKGGVRECFIPRLGFVFLFTDYSFIELCSWAQVCLTLLGISDLADVIRSGKDPHSVMAVEILKATGEYPDLTYEEFRKHLKAGEKWAKDARQLAKAANFGLPGGLGAKTFIEFAWAQYGVRIALDMAEKVKQTWLRTYREANLYFQYIKSLGGYGESFQITQLRSGRVRGGCTFTSAANSYFQGNTADGTEEADWRITLEMYLGDDAEEFDIEPVVIHGGFYDECPVDEYEALRARGFNPSYPLYGSRGVLFLHDEFGLEVPDDPWWAHFANKRLMQHMIEGMQLFIPDVPVKAEPTLMRRWYKEAEPVYDERGRLIPWEPKEKKP